MTQITTPTTMRLGEAFFLPGDRYWSGQLVRGFGQQTVGEGFGPLDSLLLSLPAFLVLKVKVKTVATRSASKLSKREVKMGEEEKRERDFPFVFQKSMGGGTG